MQNVPSGLPVSTLDEVVGEFDIFFGDAAGGDGVNPQCARSNESGAGVERTLMPLCANAARNSRLARRE
jgi:hypothetical protein